GLNFLFSLQETRDVGEQKDRTGHINLIESETRKNDFKKKNKKSDSNKSNSSRKCSHSESGDKDSCKKEKFSCKFCSGNHLSHKCKKCGNCKKEGHYAWECPKKSAKSDAKKQDKESAEVNLRHELDYFDFTDVLDANKYVTSASKDDPVINLLLKELTTSQTLDYMITATDEGEINAIYENNGHNDEIAAIIDSGASHA
ncbi:hypothetical protein HDU67_004556, partial [Dinochytrium kinnereticum]